MKPINFFIEKSESFITNLNSLTLTEIDLSWNTSPKDIYGEDTQTNNSEYNNQKNELNEIRFQIKLMFSEFDNGSLFSERLDNFESTNFFSNEPLRNNLVKNVQLFIDFLKEYRV